MFVSERDNKIERASVAGIPMRAVVYTARCTVSYFLLTVLWGRGLDKCPYPERVKVKERGFD